MDGGATLLDEAFLSDLLKSLIFSIFDCLKKKISELFGLFDANTGNAQEFLPGLRPKDNHFF